MEVTYASNPRRKMETDFLSSPFFEYRVPYYKLPPVSVQLEFSDGTSGAYRFIPAVGSDGLLLNMGAVNGFSPHYITKLTFTTGDVFFYDSTIKTVFYSAPPLPILNNNYTNLNSLYSLALKSGTLFSLDTVNGLVVSQQGGSIVVNSNRISTLAIQGWAVDQTANSSAFAAYVLINGKVLVPTIYGYNRQDVANGFKDANFRNSGFMTSVPVSLFSPGMNSIALIIVGSDGHYYYQTPTLTEINVV